MKVIKAQTFSYRISKSSKNVMYMKNIINTAVYYMSMWIRELIPRFSQERNTFISIWGGWMLTVLIYGHQVTRYVGQIVMPYTLNL